MCPRIFFWKPRIEDKKIPSKASNHFVLFPAQAESNLAVERLSERDVLSPSTCGLLENERRGWPLDLQVASVKISRGVLRFFGLQWGLGQWEDQEFICRKRTVLYVVYRGVADNIFMYAC
jgi:hypothetical protein